MTADDFETYLRGLGHTVERVTGADGVDYIVVRQFVLPDGALRGRVCDIGVRREAAVPYVPPAAIHTFPALVPMNTAEPLGTRASEIGPGWQYWSRRFDRPPTPKAFWTHILTILCDDRWAFN